ncbi:TonB family protein [Acinetobacter genomosp. 15BJ]|uniref:TonB family protein n=1 Tax=Acinetobacter genomosp. 15BJ TaxID=106651 RepID=A0ABT8US92_9GAMM|nr:TonB family protein [Acinetobacter genomosp. 15BJ]MDO3655901.1 TonB family protein [Acinetobacter genomosp. 15BJ]
MGIPFSESENQPAKRLVGIGLVLFLHLIIAYILMTSLATEFSKPVDKPVELQIIQDIKPPPKPEEPKPKEKQPEPPKMVEKVAKMPDPPKQVEKVTPVQKPAPAQPTKTAVATPTPAPTASPSPVAAPTAPAAPAAPAKPAGVSRGVSEGEAGCQKPEYPREALMNEEEGTVRIRVLVDGSGKVIDSKVKKSSGSKSLDKAAVKAYSLCTFKPAMKDGVPQQEWYEIEYPFTIS